jgi:hypothetical protein
VTRSRAERLARSYLQEWTRRSGGAVLGLTAAREGRTHWLFAAAPVSDDVHHGGPQSVTVDKKTGEAGTLGFWAMQAGFGILGLDEVRRFLDPAQLGFLEAFLPAEWGD